MSGSGRMQKGNRARSVADRMHRKIDDAFAAVGQPISKLFSKNDPGRSLICRELNSRFYLIRTAPPGRFPKRPVQHLLPCVSAPFQRQVVRFPKIASQVHDAGENVRLIEHGSEHRRASSIAIDLKHRIFTKQLHPAIDNNLAAVLARMA